MITIAWWFARSQSLRRLSAIAGCAAIATALLLIVVSLVVLPPAPNELLFEVVADQNTRGGVVLALLLLLAPVVVLTYQLVLLGSSTRTRRLAVLRVSGATSRQAGLIGAVAPALPAAAGALAGILLYGILRLVIGGSPSIAQPWDGTGIRPDALQLIPTSVAPALWQIVAVVVAVTAVAGLLGWRVSRPAATAPVGTVRRLPSRQPQPWIGLALIVVGLVGIPLTLVSNLTAESGALLLVLTGVGAVGLLVLGPWIAAQVGQRVGRRTTTASTLLGAGRLFLDPRSAGRAAAPVAVIGLVAGGASQILALLVAEQMLEAFYVISILLVAALLLIALILVAFALAAQSVETLAQHRRPTSALAASGVPGTVIERSLRAEALLVALPSAVLGVAVGGLSLLAMSLTNGYEESGLLVPGLLALACAIVVMVIIVGLAVGISVRLVRPWLHRAMDPQNLRTE